MPSYCPAVDGLYLRANGSFVCWNSPGEMTPLEQLSGDELEDVDVVRDVMNGATFREMRRALYEEREPFSFCESCSWGCPQSEQQWERVDRETFELRAIRTLQVEPSFLCNLDCPQCIPIGDRKQGRPPYSLDLRVFRRAIDDLVRHKVKVEAVQYGGFGEPLMTRDFPEMVRYANRRLKCASACDTNGNFEFRREFVECGLNWLVLACDGTTQESYARYRRRGSLARLLDFAEQACAVRKKKRRRTRICWKMVLFEWNSSDDELREACRMANAIGVDEIRFVNTTTPGGISAQYQSERLLEIRELVGELRAESQAPVVLDDPECLSGEKNRCHGFIESLVDEGDALTIGGWLLLDDGPADAILASLDQGAEIGASGVRREELPGCHPTIPSAEGGGFSLRLPAEGALKDGVYSASVRLTRAGVERVRFELEVPGGTQRFGGEPLCVRHGWTLRPQ